MWTFKEEKVLDLERWKCSSTVAPFSLKYRVKSTGQEGVDVRTSQGVWSYCWMWVQGNSWGPAAEARGWILEDLDVLAAEPSPPAQWAPFLRLFASLSACLLFLIWLAHLWNLQILSLTREFSRTLPIPAYHTSCIHLFFPVCFSLLNNLITALFFICVLGNGSSRRQEPCLPSLL